MSNKPKKIKQISAVDQVSDHLRDMIASGELKVGDRLPSESDLAESYGVNRMTVRMALQKLSVLGLVETRVGEGSFITHVTLENILREIPPSMFSSVSMDEVLQLRRMIEMESIKLAIANISDEDIEKLMVLAEKADNTPYASIGESDENTLVQMMASDYQFHYQLVLYGGNQLFASLFQLFESPIKAYLFSILSMRTESAQNKDPNASYNLRIHSALCDAMKERNWRKAKGIYLRMTEYVPL